MKVVMATPYPPKPDGIGEHTHGLIAALRARGDVQVEVLTLSKPAATAASPAAHRVLSADPRSLRTTLSVLRHANPDVVHYQFAVPALGLANLGAVAAGVRIRRELGTRLVFTFHEVRRELDLLGGLGRMLYRRLVSVADAVIVHTEDARELVLDECGADPSSVWLTALGARPPAAERVTPLAIEDVRHRYGTGDRPFALCFGYLHPDKGIEHLVDAVARLQSRSPSSAVEFDVLIAGSVRQRSGVFRWFQRVDDNYAAALRLSVDRQGLGDRVHFAGFVPADDVPALFAAARAIVVPCTKVTQSSVLSAACVSGAPVIASDLPGLRETLGDAGVLVPPCDPVALAAALETVMSDDRLAAALRDRQRRNRRRIEIAAVAEVLSGVYRATVYPTRSEVVSDVG